MILKGDNAAIHTTDDSGRAIVVNGMTGIWVGGSSTPPPVPPCMGDMHSFDSGGGMCQCRAMIRDGDEYWVRV